eukprot:320552-Chlamydomonas_euryale.AAC.41
MEAAVKHLREGLVREEAGVPTVVVRDSLDVPGGRDVLAKARSSSTDRMLSWQNEKVLRSANVNAWI